MPNNKFGLVQTKGSIARGFISVHMSDGQVDPGYKGKVTLEARKHEFVLLQTCTGNANCVFIYH
ncbi:dCTP deaminase domain-containing protein [Marinomonas rhodophyticola]|uniref:dCTP deaminase domain-containing protein n=1 Tax=Marinomonas rhodophyticola TaxID=2992803 RepID=UPI003D16BCFC